MTGKNFDIEKALKAVAISDLLEGKAIGASEEQQQEEAMALLNSDPDTAQEIMEAVSILRLTESEKQE